MSFADSKISTLAKLLEPYLRQQIRELLGPIRAKNLNATTWIQGGQFYQEDGAPASYLYPGTQTGEDAANLTGWGGWDWDESETAQAERSVVMGAFGCMTKPEATDSIAWGWDGVTYKNPCSVSGVYRMYEWAESQAARYTESSKVEMSSSWQTIGILYFRAQVQEFWGIYPDDEWHTGGIHAHISGVEINAQRSYAYKVIATTKLRNGTMTLLQEDVTTLYETDANFDVQVIVNDSTESIDFQVKDSGDSGRSVKWCIHARTSEAIGRPFYHQWTDCE